jgi:hypothetical protein
MSAPITSSRDDFPEPTKRALAARVNHRCSNPDCGAPTSGPQVEPGKALNVGVAAHIAGAAHGGPRYDPTMTPQQRADIGNGVWLCQTCAKLVDNDEVRFNGPVLRQWKTVAEQDAFDQVGKTAPRREAVQIIDKWVNTSYPENAGILQELTVQGYDHRWSTANEESERVDLQGWEPVLLDQADGTKARLKIHDHPVVGGYVVLLKRKKKS